MACLADDRLEKISGKDLVVHDEVAAAMVDGPLSYMTLTEATEAEFEFTPEEKPDLAKVGELERWVVSRCGTDG